MKGVVRRVIRRDGEEEVSDESIQERFERVKIVFWKMFSQLEEKICYVGRERFWTILIKYSDGGASVNNRIPKVNFR